MSTDVVHVTPLAEIVVMVLVLFDVLNEAVSRAVIVVLDWVTATLGGCRINATGSHGSRAPGLRVR